MVSRDITTSARLELTVALLDRSWIGRERGLELNAVVSSGRAEGSDRLLAERTDIERSSGIRGGKRIDHPGDLAVDVASWRMTTCEGTVTICSRPSIEIGVRPSGAAQGRVWCRERLIEISC